MHFNCNYNWMNSNQDRENWFVPVSIQRQRAINNKFIILLSNFDSFSHHFSTNVFYLFSFKKQMFRLWFCNSPISNKYFEKFEFQIKSVIKKFENWFLLENRSLCVRIKYKRVYIQHMFVYVRCLCEQVFLFAQFRWVGALCGTYLD